MCKDRILVLNWNVRFENLETLSFLVFNGHVRFKNLETTLLFVVVSIRRQLPLLCREETQQLGQKTREVFNGPTFLHTSQSGPPVVPLANDIRLRLLTSWSSQDLVCHRPLVFHPL